MALKSYIITKDVKSPYVTSTGMPHNPSAIRFKQFRKGEIIKGEMKHANNQPAFVLVNGVCVVPLEAVKQLVTKEVVSHANGEGSIKEQLADQPVVNKKKTPKQVRYLDAVILGSIVGFGGVFLAEKQGWIAEPEKKYRLYGALGGGLLALYAVYRNNSTGKGISIKKG